MATLQDLPLITQKTLDECKSLEGYWPLIDIERIETNHLSEFCDLDRISLDLIIKAVFLHRQVVARISHRYNEQHYIAANLWVSSGNCTSTGDITHRVTILYDTVDRTIIDAYPGGLP